MKGYINLEQGYYDKWKNLGDPGKVLQRERRLKEGVVDMAVT